MDSGQRGLRARLPVALAALGLCWSLSSCAPAALTAAPQAANAPAPALPSQSAGAADWAAAIALVKGLGQGTPEGFRVARQVLAGQWPQLDWAGNGCSAPKGLGLGYRELFTPACDVHDFAYHNLRWLEPTAANRQASDAAFLRNLWAICRGRPLGERPVCYAAAEAYYQAVRWQGSSHFAPGT